MSDRRNREREELKRKLEDLSRHIEEVQQRVHADAFGDTEEEVFGELTMVGQHEADYGTATFERELSLTQEEILEAEQREIAEALEKEQEGTYGICENCGRSIDPERLQARPYAVLCVECQRERERQMYRPGSADG